MEFSFKEENVINEDGTANASLIKQNYFFGKGYIPGVIQAHFNLSLRRDTFIRGIWR